MIRSFSLRSLLVVVILGSLAATASADEIFVGKVVVAGTGSLTIVDKDGDNEEFVVPKDAKITLDGKPAKLADLDKGDTVKVSADSKNGKLTATAIEARTAE